MSRRLRERLEALERSTEAKVGASVWWDPSDPQPEDWDRAEIQVRIIDHPTPARCPLLTQDRAEQIMED